MRSKLLALAALAIAACGGARTPEPNARRADRPRLTSNVLRRDYAGARACDGCHADISASYAAAPMHDMTRDVRSARLSAPFDGSVFRFKDDTATFETRGGDRVVRVSSRAFGSHDYRVTKVIGGRHREDFVGVAIGDDGRTGDEEILPVSWMRAKGAFRYKGYSVMSEERPGLKAGPVWRDTCIFCHNTAPQLSTLLGALVGDGAPSYQGSTADRFLPQGRRLSYRAGERAALTAAVRSELAILRGAVAGESDDPSEPGALLATLLRETRARFSERHLIDLGVGCEACHGGARAHVDDSRVRPSFAPIGAAVQIELPQRASSPAAERAQWINRTCARCHQVLFSGYPPTWEGGTRKGDPGGSHINSGEARDFLLGGCASELACTTCHDPHGRGKNAAAFAGGFANAAGDAICTSCHASLAAEPARQRHTHHREGGPGSRCVSCHMPRKNMGLDGKLTRYHRIMSPNDPRKVERDRPIECALCHADRSVGSLVADLERMWGKKYDRERLKALYGRLDDNVIRATLGRGHAHEQAVALVVIGESRDATAAPAVVELLGHKYPLVREYARDALEAMLGKPMPFDLHRERSAILGDARAWLEEARVKAASR